MPKLKKMFSKFDFIKIILPAAILLLAGPAGMAQTAEPPRSCAVEMTPDERDAHRRTVQALRAAGWPGATEREAASHLLYVPVMMHIVRSADGNDGLSTADAELALERANLKYEPVGIQFFQCGGPNIIESDYWYDLEFQFEWDNGCGVNTPEYDLTGDYQVPGLINIYWVNTNGWSWSAGPSAIQNSCMDWVVMHQGHADSYRTLAHELGHYFGLPHTFSGFDENVTRNPLQACYNCEEEGDLFCDTPADHHNNDDEGSWDGCDPSDEYDDCGVLLTPDPENLMSYCHCNTQQQHFSAEQRAAMRYNLQHGRSYISCPTDCVPVWFLAGEHTTYHTYRSNTFIQSTAELAATIAVYYQAEDEVRLLPGFRAGTGTTFGARIENCVAAAARPVAQSRKTVAAAPDWEARLTPTLVGDAATLTLDLPSAAGLSARINGPDGRLFRTIFPEKTWEPGTHRIELASGDWPAGLYRVVLQSGSDRKVLSLVKVE
jgi:hypothetical protein